MVRKGKRNSLQETVELFVFKRVTMPREVFTGDRAPSKITSCPSGFTHQGSHTGGRSGGGVGLKKMEIKNWA